MNQGIENNKHLKENRFKTPEGYFDNLEERVASLTGDTQKLKVVKKPNPYKWVSIAATLLLLFSTTWWMRNSATKVEHTLSAEDIEVLIENGYLEVNEYTILTNYSTDDLESYNPESEDYFKLLEYNELEALEGDYLYQ